MLEQFVVAEIAFDDGVGGGMHIQCDGGQLAAQLAIGDVAGAIGHNRFVR